MVDMEILGAAGALIAFMLGIWWKVEQRQDQKIDRLSERNSEQHRLLHEKIDDNHHAIRDRLDVIWKYINNKAPD